MDGNLQPMRSQDLPSVSAFGTLRSVDEQQGGVDPLAVVIASPRSDLRRQIKEYLRGTYPIHEVSHWQSLDRTISRLNPGVVLLDAELLHSSGITDLSIIRRIARKVRIIVISSSSNDTEGIAGLKAGARGYCKREIDGPLLRKAVDRVRHGEIWAERRLIPLLVEQCTLHAEELPEPPVRSDGRLALLTPREREIARLIGAGASNRDIATRLLVSEGTVKAHLTAIFRKLGFSDRLRLGLFLAKPSLKIRSRH